MVEVKVMGVSYALRVADAYLVVLEEPLSRRRLMIVVGQAEAQAIALTLEHVALPRPCTHDLFRPLMIGFDIRLERVELSTTNEATYSAMLHLERAGERIEIDSRASDAIAIALRMHAPIMIDEAILDKTYTAVTAEALASLREEDMPVDRLRERLQHFVDTEAYEDAARIQKIIAQRTKSDENIGNSQ